MAQILTEKGYGTQTESVLCMQLEPSRYVADLAEDARNGLLTTPRKLPPKYFYDDTGSELFEQITQTSEYYPTRIEDALLATYSTDIIQRTKPDQILELGSGSSRKTRRLFDACEKVGQQCDYAPMDVCEAALLQAADELQTHYGWLTVTPIVGDYHAGLDNLPVFSGRRLFVFLGSTIGNFEPLEARDFIAEVSGCMKPGDTLLVGADRVKNINVLEAAYNDSKGITAAFNLNVLEVLNRELGADFVLEQFEHQAAYNQEKQRIEMRLVSKTKQSVHMDEIDAEISLDRGESILTEVSHKFTTQSLDQLIAAGDLQLHRHYQATNKYFSLLLAGKRG